MVMTAARASTVALGVALLAAACTKRPAGGAGNGPICSPDQMACGQECVDVVTEPTNCGGCGIPCSTDQTCQGGVCQCLAGTLCNGTCLPPDAGTCPDGTDGTTGNAPTLVTSAPGAYWTTDGQLTEVTGGNANVTVNDSATAQIWEGFGGAFNELGWRYLSMLSDSERDAAIRLLYGADGARFVFGRIPIGASDYAVDRYTLDETAGDTSLANFSIERDVQALIPYVKAAKA